MSNTQYILAQDLSDPIEEGDHLINRGAGTQSDRAVEYLTSLEEEPPKIARIFGSIDKISSFLVPAGILLAVLMVVIGGYMWMTSSGSPDKVKQAQGTLTWAVIGIVFIIIASLLVKAIVDYIVGM